MEVFVKLNLIDSTIEIGETFSETNYFYFEPQYLDDVIKGLQIAKKGLTKCAIPGPAKAVKP